MTQRRESVEPMHHRVLVERRCYVGEQDDVASRTGFYSHWENILQEEVTDGLACAKLAKRCSTGQTISILVQLSSSISNLAIDSHF